MQLDWIGQNNSSARKVDGSDYQGVTCGLQYGGPMVEIHPQRIWGKWKLGYALDFHTTSSTPIGENEYGHMQFDTVRPPVAECLYRLKYRSDQAAVVDISEAAVTFLRQHWSPFEVIVPVPPSSQRLLQPVILVAQTIGAGLGVPVSQCIAPTRTTSQLKNITDPEERAQLLDGLYALDPSQTRGKNVLLFDDLFRSGSTLNAITSLLYGAGSAQRVDVLTITRTRSNQ